MSIQPKDPRLAEKPKREPGEPRDVELLGVMAFLRETVEPVVRNFETQISNFFGSQRGDRPNDPTTIRYERTMREKWINGMKPLSFFTELLIRNSKAMMVIPGWSDNLKNIDSEVVRTEICLINPERRVKFKAVVEKDEVAMRRLTPEERQKSLFILVIQVMKGAGLSRDWKMGDPALARTEEDEAQTRRIRIYTQRIVKDSEDPKGFTTENYLGVDIKELLISEQEEPRYSLTYLFHSESLGVKDMPIRDLNRIGVGVKRDSFDKAARCLEAVAGGQNG